MKDPNPFDPFTALWEAYEMGRDSATPLTMFDTDLKRLVDRVERMKARQLYQERYTFFLSPEADLTTT